MTRGVVVGARHLMARFLALARFWGSPRGAGDSARCLMGRFLALARFVSAR